MTPAIRAVRESYPLARISILIKQEFREVFEHNSDVDEILTFDSRALRGKGGWGRLWEELHNFRMLRRGRFDVAVTFYPEDRTAWWAFLCGARYRVGQRSQPFHFLFNVKVDAEEKKAGVREYFLETVRAINAETSSRQTTFRLSHEEESWARMFIQSHGLDDAKLLIGIHPGASGRYKIWPPENFAAVIEELRREKNTKVLLLQGPDDEEVVRQIAARTNPPPVVARTGARLGHLAALMKLCRLCIVADSGPRHLAAAIGTPTIAIFRKTHAPAWGIYGKEEGHVVIESDQPCPHCPAEKCGDKIPGSQRFGAYCLHSIPVDTVLSKVRQMTNQLTTGEKGR
ncbi:MAG: glycosyltransferase family 9 protein [Bacteroidota bacterium]